MVDGSPLNKTCPNAGDHGERRHQINQLTFLRSVDLDHPYIYDGIAEIVHMMFVGLEDKLGFFRYINAVNRT